MKKWLILVLAVILSLSACIESIGDVSLDLKSEYAVGEDIVVTITNNLNYSLYQWITWDIGPGGFSLYRKENGEWKSVNTYVQDCMICPGRECPVGLMPPTCSEVVEPNLSISHTFSREYEERMVGGYTCFEEIDLLPGEYKVEFCYYMPDIIGGEGLESPMTYCIDPNEKCISKEFKITGEVIPRDEDIEDNVRDWLAENGYTSTYCGLREVSEAVLGIYEKSIDTLSCDISGRTHIFEYNPCNYCPQMDCIVGQTTFIFTDDSDILAVYDLLLPQTGGLVFPKYCSKPTGNNIGFCNVDEDCVIVNNKEDCCGTCRDTSINIAFEGEWNRELQQYCDTTFPEGVPCPLMVCWYTSTPKCVDNRCAIEKEYR